MEQPAWLRYGFQGGRTTWGIGAAFLGWRKTRSSHENCRAALAAPRREVQLGNEFKVGFTSSDVIKLEYGNEQGKRHLAHPQRVRVVVPNLA